MTCGTARSAERFRRPTGDERAEFHRAKAFSIFLHLKCLPRIYFFQNSVPAIVFLQVPFAIAAGTMLRTTLIFGLVKKRIRLTINLLSYLIGLALFIGIAVGGWTDMIRGWEIKEYQGIGANEFPVYIIRKVIVFCSIIVAFIYLNLAFRAIAGTDTTPMAQD